MASERRLPGLRPDVTFVHPCVPERALGSHTPLGEEPREPLSQGPQCAQWPRAGLPSCVVSWFRSLTGVFSEVGRRQAQPCPYKSLFLVKHNSPVVLLLNSAPEVPDLGWNILVGAGLPIGLLTQARGVTSSCPERLPCHPHRGRGSG